MLTVKKVVVWRADVAHRAGELARVLRPLADAGADLQVVMGYAEGDRGIVEVCSIRGKRQTAAAAKAGFQPSTKPTLLVEGDDRPGLGADLAAALADRGISISFLVAQVAGRKYSAVIGFKTEDDARAAAAAIRKAAR